MPIRIGLDDLEGLLQAPPPKGYVSYIKRNSAAHVRARHFDPKTLCILNLELRSMDREGWTKGRFFLSGDGCGNYYFLDDSRSKDSKKVFLWAHDPPSIEVHGQTLAEFLRLEPQLNPIDRDVSPSAIAIARTRVVGESILDPIPLEEWKLAVSKCEGIRYVGYRISTNPFTGEKTRIEAPSLAVAKYGDEKIEFGLYAGRVTAYCTHKPRQLARKLAKILGANLFLGSDSILRRAGLLK